MLGYRPSTSQTPCGMSDLEAFGLSGDQEKELTQAAQLSFEEEKKRRRRRKRRMRSRSERAS
jgi:hypothetical protein